jgi:asparagine synthetase B (glutamine-hydrolysing)
MCGIGLTLFPASTPSDPIEQKVKDAIRNRGPDYQGQESFYETNENLHDRWKLTLLASVLHMRGDYIVKQPYFDNDIYLLWNGECYSHSITMKNESIMPYDIANETENSSDTELVMKLIQRTLQENVNENDTMRLKSLATMFSNVCGEYSFIFYVESMHSIYFGRDALGRRSLLISSNAINDDIGSTVSQLIVSSSGLVEYNNPMRELPAGRVYCLTLENGLLNWEVIPKTDQVNTINISPQTYPLILPFPRGDDAPTSIIGASEQLFLQLDRAVRRRVIHAPKPLTNDNYADDARVAILFSGGVDSVVLAALSHFHVLSDQYIDLINVAFASSSISTYGQDQDPFNLSPDRQAALLSYKDLKKMWPERKWRFVAVNVEYSEVLQYESHILNLISPLTTTMDFNISTAFFFASRGIGTVLYESDCQSAGLRFGNDTKVERENIVCSSLGCKRKANSKCCFLSCKPCCNMYQRPINQYFGGKADMCTIHNSPKTRGPQNKNSKQILSTVDKAKKIATQYHSKSKIILVGIGADEQMAGYGRHRSTFNRGGYEALRDELQMEKGRLWTRNLGRDDRCISSHGKEARFPFLDEHVVSFLNCLDVTELCDMKKPQGVGDKMILRIIAKQLGLLTCSGLVKRAIQFGSRIAKVSDVDRFGSSRKASGTSIHFQQSINTNQ